MFGQTTNPTFGGFNTVTQNSPFGQSAFGKPNTTTGFGNTAAPVFGNTNPTLFSAKPTGTPAGGLFGNPAPTPAFGQPTSTFGGFATTNTNTPNLFGTQQNANASLFGTNATPSAFGQTPKPGGFGFGTATGTALFGQSQQIAQQATPFGQTTANTNTNLFGTGGGFGTSAANPSMTGTVVKFNPVNGTDTMVKNSTTQTISTRHHCITCMKEYENKSFEELRLEDYQAGRKGPAQGQSTGLFGTTAQAMPFGNAPAGTSTAGTGFGMTGVFGNTSQAGTPGLFGKPINTFGAPTTTSGFAFNSSSSNNLFGTNTQAKPFGTPAPSTLFQATNTTQPTSSPFGSLNTTQNTVFGNVLGTTPSNQNIGLFNQNKSAFNMPTSTAATGFSNFGQMGATTTASNLFTKPAGTTGFGTTPLFGTTTSSIFGTNTGFTAGQTTGTSLFNSSCKPAGQSTSFPFGTTSTFPGACGGLNTTPQSNLFMQPKTGGLFGTTGANTTFNAGTSSTLGTTSNLGTGLGMGLLGGSTSTNLIQNSSVVPVHQQILSLVSTPFGDSPLLKNLLPASGKTDELLKPANAASRVLSVPQYKVTPNTKSPKVKARVVSAAQLSKKSLFEGLEEEDPILSEAFQPRSSTKRLVLRPKHRASDQSLIDHSHSNLNNTSQDNDLHSVSNVDDNGLVETMDKENLNQQNNQSPSDRRSSSTSWLKTCVPRKNNRGEDNYLLDDEESPFLEPTTTEGTTKDAINNTVAELCGKPLNRSPKETPLNSSLGDKISLEITLGNNDSSHDLEESSSSQSLLSCTDTGEQNRAKVQLRRAGYYTIPPISKLDDYLQGETCVVANFTVGREGYGNVYFEDSFDIYGLNLDEIVHFRHKEVVIYPDDEKKPPIGQGLNRKAQVTLHRVWPHDKSLHEPITDPNRLAAMNYEGKLRRVSAKHDTRFLEYRPETGSWVFKVDHFSKYGLSDSDEEDNYPQNIPKNAKKSIEVSKLLPSRPVKALEGSKLINANNTENMGVKSLDGVTEKYSDIGSDIYKDNSMNGSLISIDYANEKEMAPSPTATYARLMGTDSHKLQLMKASFFDEYNEDTIEDINYPESISTSRQSYLPSKAPLRNSNLNSSSILTPILHTNLTIQQLPFIMKEDQNSKLDTSAKWGTEKSVPESLFVQKVRPNLVVTPMSTVLKSRSELVPLKESFTSKLRFRCIADKGILMGRMFKPSWGPGLTLLSLNTRAQASKIPLHNSFDQLGSYVSGRLLGDFSSTTIVQRLRILGGRNVDEEQIQTFKQSIEGHLRIQLEHCIMGQEGDCPTIQVSSESKNRALLAHCTLAQEFANQHEGDHFAEYASDIWKLCISLWGNLHCENGEETGHRNVMLRREAVGEWLRNVVQDAAQRDLLETKNDDEKILTLLTAYKLEEACETARYLGNHCIALLMAQLQSDIPVRQLIKQQLALWQETDVDENLSVEQLKLFMLVAGEPLISSKHGTINICANLDWKRAFALHLWYLSPPIASITDIVEQYELAFNAPENEMYAALPTPEYKECDFDAESSNNKPVYDLCFHLLKLYTTGNHALEEILNPLNHTPDPLDYRLSWLMQQTLTALGYRHLSTHVTELTHVNFATQLEVYGLWHWAIFVILQLKDSCRRRTAVMSLLERYVEIDDIPDYIKREEFLKEELGISSMWINQAKALKSRVAKRYGEAAWYFIQAQEWNMAHEVIIDHLAADAIINENYDYLNSLLSPLVPVQCNSTISGWPHKGQLLWDYMEINNKIKNLCCSPDICGLTYKLEMLKPQLTSLCLKINQFPCPTAKHRLCQAEIAKRSVHMTRSLLTLQSHEKNTTESILMNLISQLPLPEDYTQQELRPITSMYVREVIGQSG